MKLGDNLMGEIYRILFEDEDGINQSSIILKIAPTNPARRKAFQTRETFLREIIMYDQVNKKI